MSSPEELESALKKAIKNLEGEKRAAIKKAKGTKGKKAKEVLQAVEDEYEGKLKELQAKHEEKLKALLGEEGEEGTTAAAAVETKEAEQPQEKNLSGKEMKQEKARRKKERQKEKERQRQLELEREEANAGPSMRQVELEQIQAVLTPLNLKVAEVEADGHCLYRAVSPSTIFGAFGGTTSLFLIISSASSHDSCLNSNSTHAAWHSAKSSTFFNSYSWRHKLIVSIRKFVSTPITWPCIGTKGPDVKRTRPTFFRFGLS